MLEKIQVRDLVEAGLYDSETQAVQDALRHLLLDQPTLRWAVAIHRYRTDERLTLARAAEIAGVSVERMKELLIQNGVPLRIGASSVEEAMTELAELRKWADAGPR